MARRVLVVGATGQLGNDLVRHLSAVGHRVRAFARRSSDTAALRAGDIELAFGDLADGASVEAACADVDAVVATASSIVPGRGDRFGELDVGWYENLLRACRRQQVAQFVYISLIAQSGIAYTIFRGAAFMDIYFAAMGSSIPLRGVTSPTLDRSFWATRLLRKTTGTLIERNGLALVPGSGRTRHAFIATTDVAAFMAGAVARNDAMNRVFDIGGPEAPSWDAVAATFADLLGRNVTSLHLPISLFRAMRWGMQRTSPATANLLAVLELIGSVDYVHDSTLAARMFGVPLTSVRNFLAARLRDDAALVTR
jgi:NADH dehydrogenase